MTLAAGCVLASARELAMQGKPALNRCTARMSCRYVQMRSENERQPAWVALTSISLRCILHNYIFTIGIYIYICTYVCIAYISSRSKGPEQEQLRSPFVPYVRNTAERSIHNFDSQPYAENFTLLHQHCAGILLPQRDRVAAEKVPVGNMLGKEFKLLPSGELT